MSRGVQSRDQRCISHSRPDAGCVKRTMGPERRTAGVTDGLLRGRVHRATLMQPWENHVRNSLILLILFSPVQKYISQGPDFAELSP